MKKSLKMPRAENRCLLHEVGRKIARCTRGFMEPARDCFVKSRSDSGSELEPDRCDGRG